MVNVVETQEHLEKGGWIVALQGKAIKETADIKEIFEDFNKTKEKITSITSDLMWKLNDDNIDKISPDTQLLAKYGLLEERAKYDRATQEKIIFLVKNGFEDITNQEIAAVSRMDTDVIQKIVTIWSDWFTYPLDGLDNQYIDFLKNLSMDSIQKGRMLYNEWVMLPVDDISKLNNINQNIITKAIADNKVKDLVENKIFKYYDIVNLKYLANYTKETIEKAIKLQKSDIYVMVSDLEKIQNISDDTIKAIKLRQAKIWVDVSDLERIQNVSDDTITNIIKLKQADILVNVSNLETIAKSSDDTIDKAIKLKQADILVNVSNLETIAKSSDDTIDKAIKLKKADIWVNVSQSHLEMIEKYSWAVDKLIQYKNDGMNISIQDLEFISQINRQIDDVKLVKEIKKIRESWPDCDISWMTNQQDVLTKVDEYFENDINQRSKTKENLASKEVDPAKKAFIDKMFRINDFAGWKDVEFVNSNGEITKRAVSGFTMEQETGNCYMIAAINAIRNNPNFAEWLYESVEYVKSENPLNTKWRMKLPITDPNGTRYEISLRELFSETKKWVENSENYSPTNQDINEFIQFLQREEQKRIRENKWWNQIVPINFEEIWELKNIYITENVKNEILEEIQQNNGKYYDDFKKYMVEYMQQDRKMFAVSAPIWYQVLEGIISKATRWNGLVNKEIMIWGLPSEILELILWKNSDYYTISLSESDVLETDKIFFNKVLENIFTWRYILTCAINNRVVTDGIVYSPYFEYNNTDLARGHAYSIVGYDKVSNMVEVVNPWDNTKGIKIPYEKFFDIFDRVDIAENKNFQDN